MTTMTIMTKMMMSTIIMTTMKWVSIISLTTNMKMTATIMLVAKFTAMVKTNTITVMKPPVMRKRTTSKCQILKITILIETKA